MWPCAPICTSAKTRDATACVFGPTSPAQQSILASSRSARSACANSGGMWAGSVRQGHRSHGLSLACVATRPLATHASTAESPTLRFAL
ncbi:hypothetical protein J2S71_001323 [Olsenella profusa DSM 13989]|nr:hypothetical protein [Olsenella profusa DSM 13989]